MTHQGKAFRAGLRLLLIGLLLALALGGLLTLLGLSLRIGAGLAGGAYALFAAFTLYFFRDPTAVVPTTPGAVVAPGHGTVDVVEEFSEPKTMGGACRRVSIFLSVFDVHVQQAPVGGKVFFREHTPGKYVNALRSDCGLHNENVLLGFDVTDPVGAPGRRVAVRLIAGLIARRIIPWVAVGTAVAKGDRMALIQFGSRADLYLPLTARITVKPGDRVVGGESIVAHL